MVSYDYYHSSEVQPIEKGKAMTQYYSKTKKELVNINDMHHQHVWYAFKKLCDRLEQLALTQAIWDDAFNPAKDIKVNANSRMVLKLEQEVSRLRRELKRLTKTNKDMYHSYFNPNSYSEYLHNLKNKGHRYVFSNIPNTEEGRQIIHKLRKWLNKDTYNMRIRGQYLDKTKLSDGETWKNYNDGQPLSKSRCIRVYLDKKKESA